MPNEISIGYISIKCNMIFKNGDKIFVMTAIFD